MKKLLCATAMAALLAACNQNTQESADATAPAAEPAAPSAPAAPAEAAPLEPYPAWAYLVPSEEQPETEVDDGSPKTVPGSTRQYTQPEINDLTNPPDWFPDEHPAMPRVVANGALNGVLACASCHLPNGLGHPESSALAGLPAAYMLRQIEEYKNGNRKDSRDGDPLTPVDYMITIAKGLTEEDSRAAAEYFASLPATPWVRVVEATEVPKSYIDNFYMRLPHPDGTMEPLGNRIIELPEDKERAERRDPKSGFVAYVPEGSIERGRELVTTGDNGKTVQCSICHGKDLKGLGEVPHITGRSPIYVYRQLNDIKLGYRSGDSVALMQQTVENLTADDMIAIAAYLGSLEP